jgi:hypothetical protein
MLYNVALSSGDKDDVAPDPLLTLPTITDVFVFIDILF